MRVTFSSPCGGAILAGKLLNVFIALVAAQLVGWAAGALFRARRPGSGFSR
jgi:hypothetical protein